MANLRFQVVAEAFKKKPLEVIKLSEVEKVITDNEILTRAREMANLQPERVGEKV